MHLSMYCPTTPSGDSGEMVGIGDIVEYQMPHSEDLTRKNIFFVKLLIVGLCFLSNSLVKCGQMPHGGAKFSCQIPEVYAGIL